jgi:uncharacterized protein
MALTAAQWRRATALETHQERLQRLLGMRRSELHALLAGNPREAAAWVRSAAECGVTAAQLSLGRLLPQGRGVTRDRSAAREWFERAATQGDPEAMNMLGRCYELGWGTAVDLPHAATCYDSSARAGHDWGQYNLANLLFDGRGVARDVRQAFLWFLRAANQGHARAMNLLGRCLEEGWGCHGSPEAAAEWYRCAAEAGYYRAQFNHAVELLRTGELSAAVPWFWKAALAGDAAVRHTIATMLRRVHHPALAELAARVERLTATAV